ncbi:hypothetical protein RHMOL_Rhmol08G0163800 [Rhododendron molle]|uniref:Uncharacterized protein n=1 Tax=Rhododendron molle TaxID=49168 RepID=A0ACC0MQ91_RHOML|nr:hypothetical protein RHMOL_Rhmol08G0163800 [Rhododendron molle]
MTNFRSRYEILDNVATVLAPENAIRECFDNDTLHIPVVEGGVRYTPSMNTRVTSGLFPSSAGSPRVYSLDNNSLGHLGSISSSVGSPRVFSLNNNNLSGHLGSIPSSAGSPRVYSLNNSKHWLAETHIA